MEMALTLASEAAANGEAPVGAVVMEGERVLAAERNRMKALNDPTAHAEMLAIRTALAVRVSGVTRQFRWHWAGNNGIGWDQAGMVG
jgi:tRNA(adenine34) deaminase